MLIFGINTTFSFKRPAFGPNGLMCSLSSPDHEFFLVFFAVCLPKLETKTSKLKY